MQSFPTETHNFYKEQSILSHPCADGSMKSVTTLKHGIDDEIMASNIKEWNPNLNTVHAQDSIIGSMVVGILGSLIDNTDVNKTSEASPSLDDVANPLTAQQANDTEEKDSLEIAQVTIKDQTDKSSKRGDGDTKTKFVETSEGKKILSAEPKKINWQKKGSGSSTTSPLTNPGVKGLAKMEKKTSVTSAALNTSGFPDRSSTIPNSGPLENISFVEFDNARSACSAIEARFIRIGDRESEIQYKKLPNQGRSNGNWGHEQHEISGQTRNYNDRRNGYSQDRW
ncbi:hypothetical protein E3N88_19796 [Mikania micrantha]|uniref:RRM domain-containing protein n=1 Tax=Mikania micrantha TaxID=192012 RepID=A0A5N6NQV8_9ASTR|nr:hypothetical protein E3N88_19796 [Mikania micrantha]